MSTVFGVLSSFDHRSQEWSSYKSRINQWFIANKLDHETDKMAVKRRAILLSAMSEQTFMLVRDLALPNKVEEITFTAVIELLDGHFTPKRFGFAEKSIFYAAVQHPGEGHSQWAARLRGLAAHCAFKNLEEALLDRFIMGMAAGHERDKLFTQNQEDLTLAKAIDLAESVKSARQASSVASPGASSGIGTASGAEGVFHIDKKDKCRVCGLANHKSNQRRYKNYKCKKCGEKGHLRKMCSESATNVNFVVSGAVDGDEGERLGMMQSLAGLAAVLARFTVRPAPGAPRRPIVDPSAVIVQSVKGGVPLVFIERSTAQI